ncbi:LysE/ArgO family amino acid transporter [Anoxybacteroides tepidamans]|uniref:LysE/ArgO family amino acid transporter n=1 Tax=Anoxybacteroides tepidamans TaxID=265948 RepID=UPI0004832298|nr:LysE/ArgO family amino acid transporter [Anoxybacillus tepidamans]
MVKAFIHGLILAFGLIIPLGAQNIFVFNQGSVQKRFINTLPVVLTASLCDTLLIILAVFGISVVILGSFWIKIILMGIGVVFLLYMGWSIWNSDPATNNENRSNEAFTPLKQIAFSASVSLLNPHAILDTIGVIGTSSLNYTGSEKIMFTAACIIVSWIWFLGLSVAGRIVGHLDTEGRLLRLINKLSAILIWGVAVYIAGQLYYTF